MPFISCISYKFLYIVTILRQMFTLYDKGTRGREVINKASKKSPLTDTIYINRPEVLKFSLVLSVRGIFHVMVM